MATLVITSRHKPDNKQTFPTILSALTCNGEASTSRLCSCWDGKQFGLFEQGRVFYCYLRLRIKQSKRLRWHREWTKIKTVRHDHICPTLQPIFQKIADNQSEIHEKKSRPWRPLLRALQSTKCNFEESVKRLVSISYQQGSNLEVSSFISKEVSSE